MEGINVFISYASQNQEFAMKACTYLEEKGKQCWIAPRNIAVGAEYGEEIIKGIENSNVVVLIFSEASNSSQHVLREVERAVSKNIPIIAYRIDHSELSKSMEYFLLSNQWLDAVAEPNVMLHHLDESIDTLMGSVKHEAAVEETVSNEKEKNSKSKTVPLIVGLCAVCVLLGAALLGTRILSNNKSSEETNEAAQTDNKEKIAFVSEDKKESGTEQPVVNGSNEIKTDNNNQEKQESELNQPETESDKKESKPDQPEIEVNTTETDSNKTETESGKTETKPNTSENETNQPESETGKETQPSNQEPALENQPTKEEAVLSDIAAGDFLQYGTYKPTGYSDEFKDENIIWQVLKVDDKNGTLQLISKDIIDIKPFDCAESGTFDKNSKGGEYDREKKDTYTNEEMMEFRGSNVWVNSDLRAWLNAAGNVKYPSAVPSDKGTDEYGNGFNNQTGFLSLFTKKERALLKETQLSDGSKNKVYLLSMDEVKEYMNTDYFIMHPQVTQSAANSDTTTWYKAYQDSGATDYLWVTRTPDAQEASSVYIVNSSIAGDTFVTKHAAISGFGIRPVVDISLKDCEFNGDGTEMSPYTISFK